MKENPCCGKGHYKLPEKWEISGTHGTNKIKVERAVGPYHSECKTVKVSDKTINHLVLAEARPVKLSLCRFCKCMTKTIESNCGKCGVRK